MASLRKLVKLNRRWVRWGERYYDCGALATPGCLKAWNRYAHEWNRRQWDVTSGGR